MAALYADENFPAEVVEELRRLGHDVLTAQQAGQFGLAVPDEGVLAYACALNRWDLVRLHQVSANHQGIVTCTPDPDTAGQARRIDDAIRATAPLAGQLIRINRPS